MEEEGRQMKRTARTRSHILTVNPFSLWSHALLKAAHGVVFQLRGLAHNLSFIQLTN